MNTTNFHSVALNEIYTSVFDEMNEEFLEERNDEDFDYEAWLDDQILFKTNFQSDPDTIIPFLTRVVHTNPFSMLELLGEINDEWVESTGDNLVMEFNQEFVAQYALWAVGNRIRTNNFNPLDNEFTRMNPAEAELP